MFKNAYTYNPVSSILLNLLSLNIKFLLHEFSWKKRNLPNKVDLKKLSHFLQILENSGSLQIRIFHSSNCQQCHVCQVVKTICFPLICHVLFHRYVLWKTHLSNITRIIGLLARVATNIHSQIALCC